jgi:ferredoxin-NADP reductase
MQVKKYRSELISVQYPLAGIIRLEFKSLNGKYKYHPGQFLHIAIDPEYDGIGQWPESRCFSMQSNPDEENIGITFAVKGRFTQLMKDNLKIGSEVWLKLPYGELFTQPHNKTNTIFIAGGTGITPFLSLFTHQSFNEYINPRIYLGFKSKLYNVYENELDRIKFCKSKIFYEDVDGLLDIKYILVENGTDKDFFISGPPLMIREFKKSLISCGVNDSQVFVDEWD